MDGPDVEVGAIMSRGLKGGRQGLRAQQLERTTGTPGMGTGREEDRGRTHRLKDVPRVIEEAESKHVVVSDSKESRATVEPGKAGEEGSEGNEGGSDRGNRSKVHPHMALKPGAEKGTSKHAIGRVGDIRSIKSVRGGEVI